MLKETLKSTIPPAFMTGYYNAVGKHRLNRIEPLQFDDSKLRALSGEEMTAAFASPEATRAWTEDSAAISSIFGEGHYGNGVDPGDRRAIYSVIFQFKPQNVLEIGTHLGASTLHIAMALKRLDAGGKLTTVDIEDVNAQDGPWHRYRLPRCPSEVLRLMRVDDIVTFVKSDSIDYLSTSQEAHDFIFLDGDHSAARVYPELSLSLHRLSAKGVVMLHDYFPEGKPLMPGWAPIKGPFQALLRVRNENPAIRVFPLGRLPWPTKLGSNATSLALVGRADTPFTNHSFGRNESLASG